MQPFNFNAGNEALRCLSIAENLLSSRDFAQCKLYATRARESDPRMEQSEQMIAIADTLMAAETRLSNQQIDWYGVLRVESNCGDLELMSSQYRRLCVLLNPSRNRFPFAENAYRLVNEAWMVLSNPSRKFEFDSVIRNANFGYNFIQQPPETGPGPQQQQQQQHNGSTHYSFIQEHSEQLQKQHQQHYEQQQFLQPFGEQQLFPSQRGEYVNEGQQNWPNQVQQQGMHWSQGQGQPQNLHWSQQQQQQQQTLPWQSQPQQLLGQRSATPQPQVLPQQPEQNWPQHHQQQQQPLPWHQARPQQALGVPQQQMPFRQSTPPAQARVEPPQPQAQPPTQPLPWHHSQPQQQSVRPLPQKPLRQATPSPQQASRQATPPPQSHQRQTQLLLPKSPPPRQQPLSDTQLYQQPEAQQPLPWHQSQPQQPLARAEPELQEALHQPTPPQKPWHQSQPQQPLARAEPELQEALHQPTPPQKPWHQSQPQQPLARAEPELQKALHQPMPPQKPLHQPTPPPKPLHQPTPPPKPFLQVTPPQQNTLRQPTPPPEIPLRQPTPPPQNPLRQPTPPPKLPVTHLSVPKLEHQPQEQQPIPWHQSKQQASAIHQFQQPLSRSPPPPQQQPPIPRPEPALPKAQPPPQSTLKTVVQSPSPNTHSPFPGSENLQHSPQYQTQTQSEPQVPSQPLPQQQPQLLPQQLQSESQSQPQSLPEPEPQPKSKSRRQSQRKPQPQPKFQPQPPPLPQTETLQPPAESQDCGENGKFQVGQQGTHLSGEKSGTNDGNPHIDESSFWTGCPYCYNMYEYPGRYAEFTLRCQNCKRAFHAAKVSTPPGAAEGKEAYFCSWALFPLGVSSAYMDQCKAAASTWTPISNMFVVPQEENHCHGGKRKNKRPKGPWIYIDDDQDNVQDEPFKEDSDDEDWHITKKKKKAKSPKGKSSTSKNVTQSKVDKSKKVKGSKIGNLQPVHAAQEGEGFGVPNMEVPSMPVGDPGKKASSVITRNRPGVVSKEMGKLDLNVEFSNEVEEPAKGTNRGSTAEQGAEDNAEGTAFFDGLDEFLNSLPILSVDGDDKVKAG
ncbi:mediator of RNA polymerase II transcription subunit 15 isoform X1 [Daucus carota subsp. sativus]